MKEVRVGIIGIGNMGSHHLACMEKGEVVGLRAVSVCDIDPQRLRAAGETDPALRRFETAEALLADPSIDAVIIAVPHPLHARLAEQALRAGKHVLLEKPIDCRVSAAERLCDCAKESDRVFAIMFNQRTNGLFAEARRILQSGELGALKRSVWIVTNWYRTQAYYDSGSWRATWRGEGGGVLLNQAPHNLDLWQWICGMPSAITAFCPSGKFHRIEVEDEATLFAEYENGATGLFVTSTGDCPGTNRLEITGTRGKVVLEEGVLRRWQLEEDEREICAREREGFPHITPAYSEFRAPRESGHRGILQNFADAILLGKPLLSPGVEGIRELWISNAAYLSQWKGNVRVPIPFDCAQFDRLLDEKAAHSHLHEDTGARKDESCQKRWQVNW